MFVKDTGFFILLVQPFLSALKLIFSLSQKDLFLQKHFLNLES